MKNLCIFVVVVSLIGIILSTLVIIYLTKSRASHATKGQRAGLRTMTTSPPTSSSMCAPEECSMQLSSFGDSSQSTKICPQDTPNAYAQDCHPNTFCCAGIPTSSGSCGTMLDTCPNKSVACDPNDKSATCYSWFPNRCDPAPSTTDIIIPTPAVNTPTPPLSYSFMEFMPLENTADSYGLVAISIQKLHYENFAVPVLLDPNGKQIDSPLVGKPFDLITRRSGLTRTPVSPSGVLYHPGKGYGVCIWGPIQCDALDAKQPTTALQAADMAIRCPDTAGGNFNTCKRSPSISWPLISQSSGDQSNVLIENLPRGTQAVKTWPTAEMWLDDPSKIFIVGFVMFGVDIGPPDGVLENIYAGTLWACAFTPGSGDYNSPKFTKGPQVSVPSLTGGFIRDVKMDGNFAYVAYSNATTSYLVRFTISQAKSNGWNPPTISVALDKTFGTEGIMTLPYTYIDMLVLYDPNEGGRSGYIHILGMKTSDSKNGYGTILNINANTAVQTTFTLGYDPTKTYWPVILLPYSLNDSVVLVSDGTNLYSQATLTDLIPQNYPTQTLKPQTAPSRVNIYNLGSQNTYSWLRQPPAAMVLSSSNGSFVPTRYWSSANPTQAYYFEDGSTQLQHISLNFSCANYLNNQKWTLKFGDGYMVNNGATLAEADSVVYVESLAAVDYLHVYAAQIFTSPTPDQAAILLIPQSSSNLYYIMHAKTGLYLTAVTVVFHEYKLTQILYVWDTFSYNTRAFKICLCAPGGPCTSCTFDDPTKFTTIGANFSDFLGYLQPHGGYTGHAADGRTVMKSPFVYPGGKPTYNDIVLSIACPYEDKACEKSQCVAGKNKQALGPLVPSPP